jgi:hypothetical protein
VRHLACSRLIRPPHLLAAALLAAFASAPPAAAFAQTAPSALKAGANAGSADSFVGPHTWYFQALPGTFTVTVAAQSVSQDSAPVNSAFGVRVAFSPNAKGDGFASKPGDGGLVISGKVAKAARVLITIVPANSPLVRVARNYTIEATGKVAFAAGSQADPIAGAYIAKRNAYGATRFNPDGSVATSDGQQGRWVLFDGALHIYTVTIGGDRMTVKLMAGRGLVDASSDVVYFEAAH